MLEGKGWGGWGEKEVKEGGGAERTGAGGKGLGSGGRGEGHGRGVAGGFWYIV